MKKDKVLVTGGAGFIGSHIVDCLLSSNYDVIVYDNLITGRIENIPQHKVKFYQTDIRDMKALNEALKGVDYVIHQGALVSVSESEKYPYQYHYEEVNVGGTINVLEAAKNNNIKRVVLASSCSVYGNKCFEADEQENRTLIPLSFYALTKYKNEYHAKLYYDTFNLESVCLRYANVYGERQNTIGEGAVIPNFVTQLIKKQSPTIYGDGHQIRDFVYVRDVARANVLALKAPNIAGKVYNIGKGEKVPILALFGMIRDILGADSDPKFAPERHGDIKKSCLDSSKANKELDWTPMIDLKEGLKRTIEWYKEKLK